jgi:hypothetical protein
LHRHGPNNHTYHSRDQKVRQGVRSGGRNCQAQGLVTPLPSCSSASIPAKHKANAMCFTKPAAKSQTTLCHQGSQTLPLCLLIPHKPSPLARTSQYNLALGSVLRPFSGEGGAGIMRPQNTQSRGRAAHPPRTSLKTHISRR